MTPEQRRGATWLYTLFFHGESAVADDLGPFVAAAPRGDQRYFLATQQADEVRHSVFFSRFFDEVVGTTTESTERRLALTEDGLNWGYRKMFGSLAAASRELAADPTRERLARAVTLYHLIVEGGLAQPGQEVLMDAFERDGLLPGFCEAMRLIAHDEQRHIAFGVRLIADLLEEDREAITRVITEAYTEVLGWLSAIVVPPGWDRAYTESLGFTIEDLLEASARSQEARLRATGLDTEHIDRFIFPLDLSPRERAHRAVTLLQAGVIGEPNGEIKPDPEAVAIVMDFMRRAARGDEIEDGSVIQWDFRDADPWYLRFAGSRAQAAAGLHESPTLTFRTTFGDWVAMGAGEANPLGLMARRRLRVRGSRRLLLKLGRVFA